MFYIFNVQGKYVGYSDSPVDEKDLELRGETVENVDAQSHVTLQEKIKQGYNLLVDLSLLPPKPSQYHNWDGEHWSDTRTQEQITEHNRLQMPNLNKRDFRKKLRDAKIFEQAEAYVRSSGDGYLEDAWDYSDYFSRLDPFIIQASEALGLTDEQVDTIWESSLV